MKSSVLSVRLVPRRVFGAALGSLLILTLFVRADAAPVPVATESPPQEKKADVTTLSPFVVQASSNDIGYYAENTLAGSRLNTNLGDLAASITVVTRQQMLDTASLDMNDVFLYEANTEGTGNYTAFSFNDQNSVDDSTSRDSATANRVRGIGAVDRAHNYYQSIPGLPFDVYNTETIEINRGPNSLLFGIGSAAGIVNQSSTAADLKRTSREVVGRYGSFGSYRTSFRLNQPIIPGKLAVFGAGLYDSRGFTRKPSYDISRRGYGAITYTPFAKTTIRANYERYTGDARRPNTVTPQDGISEWRAAGSPTWDPLIFTVTVKGVPTRLPNSTVTSIVGLGNDNLASRPQMYYAQGGPLLWMQGQLSATGVQGPFAAALPQLVRSETDEFKTAATTRPLFRTPGISDRSLYDWGSINLAATEVSKRAANIYNVEIDQQFTPQLFAQLGWYREEFHTYQGFGNGWQMVRIDPNLHLLDGSVNPYFGRPYFSAVNVTNGYNDYKNETWRANLAYELDLTKKSGWMKWLGKNRFSAIGSRNELEQLSRNKLMVTMDDHAWVNQTRRVQGGAAIAAGSIIVPRVYVGGPDGTITQEPGLVARGPLDISLRNALPASGGAFNWVNEPAHLDVTDNLNAKRTKKTTDSLTLAWQDYLWKDRIVSTLGFRRDKNLAQATDTLAVNPATGLADISGLDRYAVNSTLFGNTRTAGIVIKPLKWLSFTYNQSRNFTPAPAQFDLYRNLLPLPKGKGKDYGVRFNLLQSKLLVSINGFETTSSQARGTPADTFVQRTARLEQVFVQWAETQARAKLGTNASDSAIANEVASLAQLPVGFVSPTLSTVSSTSTVEARGVEMQVIYNPVRNWNIKATAGKQRTVYTNIAPELDLYSAERLPVWMAAKTTTGVSFWTVSQPDPAGGTTVPTSFWAQSVASPVALAKANQGKRVQGQRDWSASVISTYRVLEGRLKGAEFGGGLRLQDKAIIGYLGAAADADGVIRSLDVNKPVFDDPRPAFDFWVSKTLPLPEFFGRNVRAKVQLNVRNAFERGNRLEPIAVNPDGQPNTFRIIDPREWYLTTTFTF